MDYFSNIPAWGGVPPGLFSAAQMWGQPWANMECGYYFRDSADGGALGDPALYMSNVRNYKINGAKISRLGHAAIVSDRLDKWGGGFAHKLKFNILFADGAVNVINDSPFTVGLTDPDPREIGLTNWLEENLYPGGVLDPAMYEMDYIFFDVIDYMVGNPYYEPPYKDGDRTPLPTGPWRRPP